MTTGRVEPWTVGDGRYMRPVTYARDCESCHHLTLPGGCCLAARSPGLIPGPAPADRSSLPQLARPPPRLSEQARLLGDKLPDAWAKMRPQFSHEHDRMGLRRKSRQPPGAPAMEERNHQASRRNKIDPDAAGKDIRLLSGLRRLRLGAAVA